MTLRRMKIVVAMDADKGIGKNGDLPWSLKGDLRHFAKVTKAVQDPKKKNAVIMGRKCWESIPEKRRPLAGRLNVVLSRKLPQVQEENVIVMNSFESALKLLSTEPFASQIETIFNIGGAEIYEEAMRNNWVDELYITHIYERFDADVQFKAFDKKQLIRSVETSEENSKTIQEDEIHYEFVKYTVPRINA